MHTWLEEVVKNQWPSHFSIDHAKAEGSSDNMTAIVVFFDTFELKEPPQAVSESESSEDENGDNDDW